MNGLLALLSGLGLSASALNRPRHRTPVRGGGKSPSFTKKGPGRRHQQGKKEKR